MASVNKVFLLGRVGKDPEVKYTQNGKALAKFSIATTEYSKSGGERQEKTEWHNIVVWDKLAETVEKYVKKGALLYVEGTIRYSQYEDKEGVKRNKTEIQCWSLQMLGGKDGKGNQEAERSEVGQDDQITDADVPF